MRIKLAWLVLLVISGIAIADCHFNASGILLHNFFENLSVNQVINIPKLPYIGIGATLIIDWIAIDYLKDLIKIREELDAIRDDRETEDDTKLEASHETSGDNEETKQTILPGQD